MEAAKENFAEQQKANALPEGDCVPSKDRGYQDVPQTLDHKAEDGCPDDDKDRDSYSFKYWMMMHVLTPYFFPKSS